MKKLIPLFVLLAGACSALSQGVVWFDARPAYLTSPPDRRVLMPDGTAVQGPAPGQTVSTYWAQLYYQDNTGAWVAHSTVARFFTSAANAGFWNGGSRTLVNAGSPSTGVSRPVQMQVYAWDGGTGATPISFDQARASGRLWGTSQVFTYTEEWNSPRGTSDTYMKTFTGFQLIPEPSVIGLGIIGVGALFLLRRRK
jgi:hypothetical protein